MKKSLFKHLLALGCAITMSTGVAACGNDNAFQSISPDNPTQSDDTSTRVRDTVPVYQGMTLSKEVFSFAAALDPTAKIYERIEGKKKPTEDIESEEGEPTEEEPAENSEPTENEDPEQGEQGQGNGGGNGNGHGNGNGNGYNNGNHYGHNDHDQEIEEPIEDLVTIEVQTDEEVKYYVEPGETFIVEVHISNPDQFEIQSFTLNNKKYANYMFEQGSTMELLLLKVTAPNAPGYYDYTIDAIKYIDGTVIKDVDMSQGNKKIKTGIKYPVAPSVHITSQDISTTYAEFNVFYHDQYSIADINSVRMYLTDGEQRVATEPIYEGNNRIRFNKLLMSRSYEYGVLAVFDQADGRDVHSEWLSRGSFTTLGAYSINNVVASKDSISFNIDRQGESGTIDAIRLYDANTEAMVAEINTDQRVFENLLSDHTYALFVDFSYGEGDSLTSDWVSYEGIRTLAKVQPTLHVDYLNADKTSIGYSISADDVDGIVSIDNIELLHNGEVVSRTLETQGSFDNLLSDNDYSIKVSYSYDLNDGQGVLHDSLERSVRTLAKIQPTISINPDEVGQESIHYAISTDDVDQIASITKVELLHGNDVVAENNGDLEGSFENLLSNNAYRIRVHYSYDLNDGTGIATDYVEKPVLTLSKSSPSMDIVIGEIGQEGMTYSITVNDVDHISSIDKVQLIHDDVVVAENDGSLSGGFSSLLSNNDYSIKIIYTYDLNDGTGPHIDEVTRPIITLPKAAPVVELTLSEAGQEEISYSIAVNDIDHVSSILKVQLLDGQDVVKENGDSLTGSFTELQSNSDYSIKVVYEYDLNDGVGARSGSVSKNLHTTSKTVPTVQIVDVLSTKTSISFGIETDDVDNILTLENAQLLDNGEVAATITDLENPVFEGLPSGHNYTIAVNYSYDLNDGDGVHQRQVTYDYMTLVETISVTRVILNNTKVVKSGESISLRVNFDNPSNIRITEIYVNDQPVQVIGGNSITNAIVEFVPEETGLVDFKVSKVSYMLNGILLSQATNEEVYLRYPVYTELKNASFSPVSATSYGVSAQGMIFHFDNELDYEIESFGQDVDFRALDKNTYFVRSNNVSSIEYGYEGYGLTSQTFSDVQYNYENYCGYRTVSTPEDFLAMADGYYILTNDIDMMDYPLSSSIKLSGYLYGNGHKISNLTQVVDTGNTNYYDPFTGGTIDNVVFDGLYISITGSQEIRPLGYSRLYNCSVDGDINGSNGAYLGYIGNENNSSTIDLRLRWNGQDSAYYVEGTPLESNQYVSFEDGFIYFRYGNFTALLGCYDPTVTSYTAQNEFYIGNYAFQSCSNLTSFQTAPHTVVGNNAVPGQHLTSATLDVSQLSSLDKSSLESVTIVGEGVIPDHAFYGCGNLKSVIIGEGVTGIGNDAFRDCPLLNSVTLPSTLTSIGDFAFSGCSSLSSICLPEGLVSLGTYAFGYCASLASIVIPEGVTSIGDGAFYNCSALTQVILPSTLTSISSNTFNNCGSLTSIVIPEGVTSIGEWAFSGCIGLASITLPSGLTTIGQWAFQSCLMRAIVLPDSISSVGEGAFSGTSLSCVFFQGTQEQWDAIAFGKNNGNVLSSTYFETNSQVSKAQCVNDGTYSYILSNDNRIFELSCVDKSIATIDLVASFSGKSIITIAGWGFDGCSNLKAVIIPASVISVGYGAFNCSSITHVFYKGTQQQWNAIAFADNNYPVLSPEYFEANSNVVRVESVNNGRFSYVLADNIRVYGIALADRSIAIADLPAEFPGKVLVSIAVIGFSDSSLQAIVVPSSIALVGNEAFRGCNDLNVFYEGTQQQWNAISIGMTNEAFQNPSFLEFNTTVSALKSIDDGKLSYLLVDGARVFGLACSDKAITSFDFALELPGKEVISIGRRGFASCANLSTIVFPSGLQIIGEYAFEGCDSLKAIAIPASVHTIGYRAFPSTNYLKTLFYAGTQQQWESINVGSENYLISNVNLREYESSVTSLQFVNGERFSYVLANDSLIYSLSCSDVSITSFNFASEFPGKTLVAIDVNGFSGGCTGLSAVVLPSSLRYAGYGAFSGTSLTCVFYQGTQEQWNAISFGDYNDAILAARHLELGSAVSWARYFNDGRLSYVYTSDDRVFELKCLDNTIASFDSEAELPGKSVITIADNAFFDFDNLVSVTLSSSVVDIGNDAFHGCESLVSIAFGESLARIGSYAFTDCSSMTAISLPASLRIIGYGAFGSVPMQKVFFGGTQEQWNAIQVDGWNDSLLNAPNIEFNSASSWSMPVNDGTFRYVLTSEGLVFDLVCLNKEIESFDFAELFPGKTLISIASGAFSECDRLTSVSLPEGLTSIASSAFNNCTRLSSIAIPEGVTSIGESAFRGCASLSSVAIPEGVTSIGNSAFENCSSLVSAELPSSLMTIGDYAFNQCEQLVSVSLPEGLSSLGNYAFQSCWSLKAIVVPASLKTVGSGCFNYDIDYVFYRGSQEQWDAMRVGDNNARFLAPAKLLELNSAVTAVERFNEHVYSYVLTNDNRVFDLKCLDQSITSFDFEQEFPGKTLASLANGAFDGCASLVSVALPSSLSAVSDTAFRGCTSLASITIPEGVTSIGGQAFELCSSLSSVTFPSTLSSIGSYAFNGCEKLTAIALPEGLISLGEYAFQSCWSLKAIVVPASLKTVGNDCFNYYIDYAFYRGSQEQWDAMRVGNGNAGFLAPAKLLEPNSSVTAVEFVNDGAYSYILTNDDRVFDLKCLDSSITEFNFEQALPNKTLISLGGQAFYNCSSLAAAVLPSTILSIGGQAFDSTNLACVFFAGTQQQWEAIQIDAGNVRLLSPAILEFNRSITGATLVDDGTFSYILTSDDRVYELKCSDADIESFDFPQLFPGKTLVSLADGAFKDCSCLGTIDLPNGLVRIGEEAFSGCSYLSSVTLPQSVSRIGNAAFYKCTRLASIVIPEGMTGLESNVFYGCSSLAAVTLPSTLASIGAYAFYNCKALAEISIPENVVVIGNNAFDSCSSLSSIVLPSGLTSIEYGTFQGCSSLSVIAIPSGVTSIGAWAFQSCTGLKAVLMPTTVRSIGEYAFSNCPSIAYVFFSGTQQRWDTMRVNEGNDNLLSVEFLEVNSAVSSVRSVNDGTYSYILASDGRVFDLKCVDQSITCFDFEQELPDKTLISLGNEAFSNCEALASVVLPETLVFIRGNAFYYCSALKAIVLSSSLERVGENAFYGSTLSYVFYRGTQEQWGAIQVAYGNSSLLSPAFFEIESDVIWAKSVNDGTYSYILASDGRVFDLKCVDQSITSFDFEQEFPGKTLVSLASGAFDGCSYLSSAALPSTISSISSSAFNNCTRLSSIAIPEGVACIGEQAFGNCSSLVSAELPSSLMTIGDFAFNQCGQLSSVSLPEGLSSLGSCAFQSCYSLKEIAVPASLKTVGSGCFNYDIDYVFYRGSQEQWGAMSVSDGNARFLAPAKLFELNSTVEWAEPVNDGTYSYVLSSDGRVFDLQCLDNTIASFDFEQVFPGKTLASLANGAFDGCASLVSVALPSSLSAVSDRAFRGCTSLASITIPEGAVSIGESAFYNCTSLASVTFPSTLSSIGSYAFNGCGKLTAIVLPEGLISLGEYAFQNCWSLKAIVVPASLKTVGSGCFNYDIGYVFYRGSQEQWDAMSVSDGNARFLAPAKLLELNSAVTAVERVNDGAYSYVLTNDNQVFGLKCLDNTIISFDFEQAFPGKTLVSLANGAFDGCASLSSVALPASLTSIAGFAFSGCSSLASVTIPEGVVSVGEDAFYGCASLSSVAFPSSLVSIGDYAFWGCSSLCAAVLPPSIRTIGNEAFYETALSCVFFAGTQQQWDAIQAGNNNSTLLSPTYLELNSSVAWARPVNDGVYSYLLTSDGRVFDLKCLDSSITEFNFEQALPNKTLISLGRQAFYNCSALESIVLPSSLISIGASAFSGCSSLTSITIPDGISSIGDYTFYGCSSLCAVVLPSSIRTIGNEAFYEASLSCVFFAGTQEQWDAIQAGYNNFTLLSPAYLELNGSVAWARPVNDGNFSYVLSNDNRVFNLKCLDDEIETFDFAELFPGKVLVSLADEAFKDHLYLTTVSIPQGLTSIGRRAFSGCAYLSSVSLPNGVASIGEYAFSECNRLTSIVVPEGITSIESHVFYHCTTLGTVSLPSTLKTVGEGAFQECYALASVSIPEGVTSIGDWAFDSCHSLASVSLPSTLTTVGAYSFYNCGLVALSLPSNLVSIGEHAFESCNSLKAVAVPSSLRLVADWAFGYDSITYVFYIGTQQQWSAVRFGENNNSLLAPAQLELESAATWVKFIDNGTYTYYLTSDGRIYELKCYDANIESFDFAELFPGKTLMSLKEEAFANCALLSSVVLPSSLTSVGNRAFCNCASLSSIDLPSSLASIGGEVFSGCSSLASVALPDGIDSLPYNAFFCCTSLSSVILPSTLSSIGAYAFYRCTSLASIMIPEGVTSIGDHAFCECASLSSVVIPDGVTSIGDQAFESCSSLSSVTFPSTLSSIGRYAFNGCEKIAAIVLPEDLISLGEYAFQSCWSLKAIVVPASLKTVGSGCFNYDIDYVFYHGSQEQWDAMSVGDNNAGFLTPTTLLELNSDALTAKRINDGSYSYFLIDEDRVFDLKCVDLSIESFDSQTAFPGKTIVSLGYEAFSGCTSLVSAVFPAGLISIGERAFANCGSLAFVGIPDGLTSIGSYAFNNCSLFKAIALPSSLSAVGYNVFGGSSLSYVFYAGSQEQWNAIQIDSENYVFLSPAYFELNSNAAWAIFVNDGTYSYILTSDNRVFDLKCLNENVESFDFESEFPGKTLMSLKEEAFAGCTSLSSVVLPQTLTAMGNDTFRDCSSLSSIVIPESITTLPAGAFYNNTSLNSVSIPDSVTSIGRNAFYGCTTLASIDLPDGLTTIGEEAFSECSSLTSIVIPDGVSSLSAHLFSSCTSLSSIILPSALISIGDYAFYYCTSLSSIVLPASLTSVGGSAFIEAYLRHVFYAGTEQQWNNIQVAEGNYYLLSAGHLEFNSAISWAKPVNDGTYSYILSSDNRVFELSCVDRNVVSFDFEQEFPGKKLVSLVNGAFDGCSLLVSVALPSSLSAVSDRAFYGCSALSSVTLGENVASIGSCAFYGCSSLASIVIPEGVTSIGDQAFENCSSLSSVTLPLTLSSTGRYSFNNCGQLTAIALPEGLISLGEYTFQSCNALKTIVVPSSLKTVDYGCFNCTIDCVFYQGSQQQWEAIQIGDNNNGLLAPTRLLEFNSAVASINRVNELGYSYLLTNDDRIIELKYLNKTIRSFNPDAIFSGKTILTFAEGAFKDCDVLQYASIPNGMTKIPSDLFNGCTKLEYVFIPASVTVIDERAFEGVHLSRVYYSGTEQQWDAIMRFSSESNVYDSTVHVVESDAALVNDGNFSYILDGLNISELACVNRNLASIDFAEAFPGKTIVSIAVNGFGSCKQLTTIAIPEGVSVIPDNAFDQCTALASITLPSTITAIGKNAFGGCTSLTSIALPNGIETIGDFAFSGCTSLVSITIPGSLASIGEYCFFYCGVLSEVFYAVNSTAWAAIELGEEVESELASATVYFYSEYDTGESNIWHYVDGIPTVW